MQAPDLSLSLDFTYAIVENVVRQILGFLTSFIKRERDDMRVFIEGG